MLSAITAAFAGLASLKGILEALNLIASKIEILVANQRMQSRIDSLEKAVTILSKAQTTEEREQAAIAIAQATNS